MIGYAYYNYRRDMTAANTRIDSGSNVIVQLADRLSVRVSELACQSSIFMGREEVLTRD
jgi:hypothetical protein